MGKLCDSQMALRWQFGDKNLVGCFVIILSGQIQSIGAAKK